MKLLSRPTCWRLMRRLRPHGGGEQGRGFAVVADEVRGLAQRTQQSVEEMVNIVEQLRESTSSAVTVMSTSRQKGAQAVEQVTQAGEMLDSIAGQVRAIATKSEVIAQRRSSRPMYRRI